MRRAAVVVTLCLFAWLALLAPPSVLAQDRSRSSAPEDLWKEYPLAPTAAPSAQPTAASASPAPDRAERAAHGAATSGSDDGAPGIVFVLLALLTMGGSLTILRIRRRRESEPHAAAEPNAPTPVRVVPVIPAMWLGRSGRFTRVTGSRATATVASSQAQGRPGPRAGGDAPVPRAGALPRAKEASPLTPAAEPRPAGSPPDRRLGWTAEIEWRHTDGESRFCVIARGAGTVVLAQSPPQEWPPTGRAAVRAMTDAAEQLAATLTAAGWKALPAGPAWYAKRFAWEPARSTATAAVRPVTSSSPATPVSARRGSDALRRLRSKRPRRLHVALLCVLVAIGPVAALTLSGGHDDAPAVRPAPAPVTKAPDTPAARPKPTPAPSTGTDLTIPLLVILGLLSIGLAIRQTRRVLD